MKKSISLLLALLMLFTLCACGAGEAAPSVPEQASPSFRGDSLGGIQTEPVQTDATEEASRETQPSWPTQRFSNEGGTSIDVLREEIAQAGAMFGVA